jgi:hypothetical protein
LKAALLLLASLALQTPTARLGLFVYSRDTAHGFKDESLEVFRRAIGEQVEEFLDIAYSREEAYVSVQYLGPGELSVELGEIDEPARYFWRADEKAIRTWAVLRIGSFSKEFSVEGHGARDLSRLAKMIADWVRENSAALRR